MFYIRADASAQIGIGHIKRCIAIAEGLKNRGQRVEFLSRTLSETAQQALRDAGIDFQIFPQLSNQAEADEVVAHSHWLSTSQEQDAEQVIKILQMNPAQGVIVDHYALSAKWEREIQALGTQVIAVDDLCDRPHSADILIDYNWYSNSKDYSARCSPKTKLLLGPSFAPIRQEFLDVASLSREKNRTQRTQHILVFMGGGDPHGYTRTVIKSFKLQNLTQRITVVLSKQNIFYPEISLMCEEQGIKLIEPTSKIAELLNTVDIALAAGGVAQIERSYLGIPSIITSVAHNQTEISENLHKRHACIYLGPSDNLSPEHWSNALQNLLRNSKLRREISEGGMTLFDGQGVSRILNHFVL